MLRTMTLALAMTALIAGPVAAQDQAGPPVEANAPAAAPSATPAAGPAKRSLAEKMAIAAGVFGAGLAAYKLLKPGKADAAPATPASAAPAGAP